MTNDYLPDSAPHRRPAPMTNDYLPDSAPHRGRSNEDGPKLPPNAPEAERGVLGCIILEATDHSAANRGQALEECMRQRLTWQHFYDLRNQVIYQTILALHADGKPADTVLLVEALKANDQLNAVGGILYLSEIQDYVPSTANITLYLAVLIEKHALRQALRICTDTISKVYETDGDLKGFVGRFESQAMALSEAHVPTEYVPVSECLPAYIDAIESRHRGKQEITGLATPFWYLNNMTAGLQPREFVVIGARPSTGKTAIGLDILRHAAKSNVGVLMFSIEMARQDIVGRLVAAEAQVDGMKLRNGFWTEAKAPSIEQAAGRVAGWGHVLIDDRSFVTGQDVFIAARRAQRQHGVQLVLVDYIQLMQSANPSPGKQRLEIVAEASAWLKRTAKELNVSVVACAQLVRDAEGARSGRPPTMDQLRECGNIEQDADVIALLYEPKIDDADFDDMKWIAHHTPDDPKEDSEWAMAGVKTVPGPAGKSVSVNEAWKEEFRRINLVVAKNRNGATGPCELVFQKRSARFVDAHSPQRAKADKGTLI
jgi:replicative DNA helicase